MSKAEEKAQAAYPAWRNGIGDEFSSNSAYYGFINGHHQAETDIIKWIEKNAANYMERQKTIFGTIKVFNTDKLIKDLKETMID